MEALNLGNPTPFSQEDLDPITSRDKRTSGNWTTEPDAAAAFDHAVMESGLFRIYREIRGQYLTYRWGQEQKGARIDRVLAPTEAAWRAGWTIGPVGVELKASGVKLGPVISQVLDYHNAVWELPHGYLVKLQWLFVFPIEKPYGPLASTMDQHCVGAAWVNPYSGLQLKTGSAHLLDYHANSGWQFKPPQCGRRSGSR